MVVTERFEFTFQPANLVVLAFDGLAQHILGLPERLFSSLIRGRMGRFLCADSRVAIDDDAFEPGAFDCMLARHTFERVERVAEMIQRVPSPVVFGGQPLEFRFVARLRPLELDPLVVVAVAQRLELAARRVEGLPERVTFRFDLPDRFLSRAEATFVIGSLFGEVRLPLRSAFGRPPAESRSRREQTTARAREFGTCLAEIVFDVGAQFDLASEIVLDRLLTGAGGHPFAFGELLGVLQRELASSSRASSTLRVAARR